MLHASHLAAHRLILNLFDRLIGVTQDVSICAILSSREA